MRPDDGKREAGRQAAETDGAGARQEAEAPAAASGKRRHGAMRPSTRIALSVAVLCVSLGGTWTGYRLWTGKPINVFAVDRGGNKRDSDEDGRSNEASAPGAVTAAAAAEGRSAGPIRANGLVKPSQWVEVGTQQTGQLRTLHVSPGDAVMQGQLLAEIDPDLAQNAVDGKAAAVAQANADLHVAQADLQLARLQKARAMGLMAHDAMARRDYERAKAEWARMRARVEGGQAAVRAAQMEHRIALKNLEQTRLLSPIDGVVINVLIKEGQMVVGAQTAQVVLEVANLKTMTIEAHVAEADVPYIEVGQKVSFSILADAGQQWHSTLRRIDPGAIQKPDTAKAIYYRALFDVDNADGKLRPMMTAEVAITVGDARIADPESGADLASGANGDIGHSRPASGVEAT